MCDFAWVCVRVWVAIESDPPKAAVTCICEPFSVGVGSRTWVLERTTVCAPNPLAPALRFAALVAHCLLEKH